MMLKLEKELWKLDAESGWTSEEVQASDGELRRLRKFLDDVLAIIHRLYPELDSSFTWRPGW